MSTEKRELTVWKEVDTIVCDIEGTTTSISFVKDVLFPYVRQNVKSYLVENFETQEFKENLNLLIEQSKEDFKIQGNSVPIINEAASSKDELINEVVRNVLWQMDADRKTKPLKQLQGQMWIRAYETGIVKGHIYDDVVPAFSRWISKNLKIYIYSSGSVEAQKILFRYSDKGDISKYISGNFDTNIGMKVEAKSYENILASIGKSSSQVLFLTDLIREAEAAKSVGIQVGLLRRSDNPDKETKQFEWIESFDQIKLANE